MVEDNSWIKLFRRFTEWQWYQDPEVKIVFLHLLLKANNEDKKWMNIIVKRGQIVIGIPTLAEDLRLTYQQTRTALAKLQKTGEINRQSTNRFSLITINNFNLYQQVQQSSNRQSTTTKEYKNIRYKISKDILSTEMNKKVEQVVSFFEEKFQTKVRVLTEKRKSHIKARLNVFSLEEIQEAISNFSLSSWHRGENDRSWKADLDFIVRSDENIEKGLKLKPKARAVSDEELRERIKNYGN